MENPLKFVHSKNRAFRGGSPQKGWLTLEYVKAGKRAGYPANVSLVW
ncbi:hypothetical protein BH11BAC5_BH11BAC5_54480 [soil metagenome]